MGHSAISGQDSAKPVEFFTEKRIMIAVRLMFQDRLLKNIEAHEYNTFFSMSDNHE